eukprot:1183996-Pleurochrysis_carterae.AAC.3
MLRIVVGRAAAPRSAPRRRPPPRRAARRRATTASWTLQLAKLAMAQAGRGHTTVAASATRSQVTETCMELLLVICCKSLDPGADQAIWLEAHFELQNANKTYDMKIK